MTYRFDIPALTGVIEVFGLMLKVIEPFVIVRLGIDGLEPTIDVLLRLIVIWFSSYVPELNKIVIGIVSIKVEAYWSALFRVLKLLLIVPVPELLLPDTLDTYIVRIRI